MRKNARKKGSKRDQAKKLPVSSRKLSANIIEPVPPSMRKIPIGWLREIVIFLLGTLFGVYVVQWFIAILPGPSVGAALQGVRGDTANTIGCIYYSFSLNANDPIEYLYAKFQLPNQINDYKFGLAQEFEVAGRGRVRVQGYQGGKDKEGKCNVGNFISNNADVEVSARGNMIGLHASKLAPKTMIMGLVATTEAKSTGMKLYTEGAYEYIKLGQTVRKALPISDKGIADSK